MNILSGVEPRKGVILVELQTPKLCVQRSNVGSITSGGVAVRGPLEEKSKPRMAKREFKMLQGDREKLREAKRGWVQ
ncbi:hypothetical protein VNO77_44832 [Canavalia gladiata]|uniref:Uncharacterized protein n=1 Tax=Canavalia gladiata TaxID=3824 RepID=A0AAN9PR28_CANGL